MKEVLKKMNEIEDYCEAGILLEHMYLFEELRELVKLLPSSP